MKYYRLITNPQIFVEFDPIRNIFRHWNSETHIGKKDNISSYVISKLINKKLIPIMRHEFETMFDRTIWRTCPPYEYITLTYKIGD